MLQRFKQRDYWKLFENNSGDKDCNFYWVLFLRLRFPKNLQLSIEGAEGSVTTLLRGLYRPCCPYQTKKGQDYFNKHGWGLLHFSFKKTLRRVQIFNSEREFSYGSFIKVDVVRHSYTGVRSYVQKE